MMYEALEVESTTPLTLQARSNESRTKKRGFMIALLMLGVLALVLVAGSYEKNKWSASGVATREAASLEPQGDDLGLGNEVEDLSTPAVTEADLPVKKSNGEKDHDMFPTGDDENLKDMTEEQKADNTVVEDHYGWDRCTKLVGGTSRPIVYGPNHHMWKGTGHRTDTVQVHYGGWRLTGGRSRALAFLSGFDIATGPNTRINIRAHTVNLMTSRVTVATWANTRVWASKFGFLATSLPPSQFAMTSVNTLPVKQFTIHHPQTRHRVVYLPCRVHPMIFAALNHLDVTHTTTINTRLKLRAWATKLHGPPPHRVRLSVKFETWANSKVYVAGAAVAAWCPVGHLGAHVSTGSVTFHGGGGNRMWNGHGEDRETRYVRFRRKMHCPHPQVSIGLTAIDFGRNKNYRLFVSPANVNDLGFNVIFRSWSNTKLWWARVSYVAICPE